MSDCRECEDLIIGYGALDRSCDKHWREDHPNGIRFKTKVLEVDHAVLRNLFAGGTNP